MHVKTSSTPTSFPTVTVSSFQRNIRAIYTRKNDANCTIYTSMSYLIRRVLAKPRLILDEMSRLYGKFASYLRRVLCKTRLIFPRINGPIISFKGVGQEFGGCIQLRPSWIPSLQLTLTSTKLKKESFMLTEAQAWSNRQQKCTT